ncbi:hypothetical protein GCM10020218_027930 [Dactylosporangium vinaceum]
MRAVQFTEYGPPSVVHVDDIPEPHAGPGEIRIAVRASGFSPGETIVRSGRLQGVIATPLPYRTGFDAAGVVDEIGAGVTGAAIGDAVFGMTAMSRRGANADFAVLVAWAPKPAAWNWAEAGGATGPLETSARVLDRLALGPGRTLLINGAAGGTGAVAVQVARARGLRVIGTASEANHDFLRSLGAEPTTYGEGLPDRVKHADGVFDCFGGALPDLIAIAGGPGEGGDDRRLRRGRARRAHVQRLQRPARGPRPAPHRPAHSRRGDVRAGGGRRRARAERDPPRTGPHRVPALSRRREH